jgi:hypothetical protein
VQRKLARIAALAATILTTGVASAEDDVLYWMIDDSATVTKTDGTEVGVSEFLSNPVEGSAFAARIRVTGESITEDTFLDLYVPGYGIDVGSGECGVEFSTVGGYWGSGVPTGNQSPLGSFSAAEYSFIIELGNIDSSDNWTTVATSAATAYSDLADYIYQAFDLSPSPAAVWTPTTFNVPEPSGGLLTMMGLALLALRRKRLMEGA